MDSEKSINSFEMKKYRLLDYLLYNYFFYQLVDNFLGLLLLWKINILNIFDCMIFFRYLLNREVLTFWSNKTFYWECMCHKSLNRVGGNERKLCEKEKILNKKTKWFLLGREV